ncbi:MAG: hypothetical protein RL172_2762 [Bacteroidota bacterium]|jgi:Ca2+:H+ antiporter
MQPKSTLPSLKYILIPILCWIVFFIKHTYHFSWLNVLAVPALLMCTLQAVHHAEVIAHRVGEPFGTLVLALAVTIIEVSLIISMMMASGPDGSALARDTVFAAIMIIITGMIGISLLSGGIRHREQSFGMQGVTTYLITLLAVSVLTLILPNYTTTIPGPYYSVKQLVFVAIVSLLLYASFIFVQNFKHKDLFVDEVATEEEDTEPKPSKKEAIWSFVLLFVCLGAVIMLAESLAPDLEDLIDRWNAPHSLVGIIIAIVVLLPEGLSAFKAASGNKLQKSLNLSLGSALASICLSIPTVTFFSIVYDLPLTLGIDARSSVIFLLAMLVLMLSFRTGKTIILQGIVLLLIFFTYIFMTIFP